MGDDQLGLAVAGLLQQRNLPDTVVTLDENPGIGLVGESEEAAKLLIIVDAAVADERRPIGSSVRIDYAQQTNVLAREPKAGACVNPHTLGVEAGLELAAAMDALPPDVWIYAIFGESFERNLAVTDQAADGIERLADTIERDVLAWTAKRHARAFDRQLAS